MKIIRFHYWTMAMMLLCVACGPNQPAPMPESDASTEFKPEYPIPIQLSCSEGYKNTLTLNDLVSDIQYIPLETHKDGLIGKRHSLPQYTNEYIFIETMGRLMQFDRRGRFVRRISRMGNGPEECTVWNYGIDEKRGLVYIFDYMKKSVLTFNFEGEYVKTIRNPFAGVSDGAFPEHMGYDEVKGNLFFTFSNNLGNMKYKYVVTDTAGTILYRCPNYTRFQLRQSIQDNIVAIYPLYRYNSSYYCQHSYNDTIFVINEDYTCSPAYIRNLPNSLTLKDNLEAGAGIIDYADLSDKNSYNGCREDGKYLYLYHTDRLYNKEYISLLSLV